MRNERIKVLGFLNKIFNHRGTLSNERCLKAAVFSGLVAVRSFLSLIGTAAELRSVRAAELLSLWSSCSAPWQSVYYPPLIPFLLAQELLF